MYFLLSCRFWILVIPPIVLYNCQECMVRVWTVILFQSNIKFDYFLQRDSSITISPVCEPSGNISTWTGTAWHTTATSCWFRSERPNGKLNISKTFKKIILLWTEKFQSYLNRSQKPKKYKLRINQTNFIKRVAT